MAATPERRPRLDQERVLATAESLLDEHGLDALTMTMLAGALDTKVSSLYNHVASLDELRAQIQIRAMRLLASRARTTAMGKSGEDGLRALATTFLTFAREFPHRYDAMTRIPLDRAGFFAAAAEAIEAVAVMIGTTGVAPEQKLVSQIAMFASLHGYASLEAIGFLEPVAGLGELDMNAVYEQVVNGAISAVFAAQARH